MVLATVPEASPTRRNQRATSCPAPISAKEPKLVGSRLRVRALWCVSRCSADGMMATPTTGAAADQARRRGSRLLDRGASGLSEMHATTRPRGAAVEWARACRSRDHGSRVLRNSRKVRIRPSCHRVPAVIRTLRGNPFGQRHDQEARQRVDVRFVHRAEGPELGDRGLVRAKPDAYGSDEALESLLF